MKILKPLNIFVILLISSKILLAKDCNNKVFNLSSSPSLNAKTLLEEIASECNLSISYEDRAKEVLDSTKTIFNFRNKKLNDILSIIAKSSDTNYSLENGLITFSQLQTKTFHINYISTARVGSSNTDVVYGQESSQYLSPYSYYNYNYTNTQTLNTSATGDDVQSKALSQATQNPMFGKSGTKIYSIDELNFWGELENELIPIIYQEDDSYNPKHPRIIINKGAGLVTISATNSQLKRAQEYISTLKRRLGKQVQIDVHILSVEHSDINTTGINWAKLYELGINTQDSSTALLSAQNDGINYGVYLFGQGLTIGDIIQFLKEYGKTKSVSNPKIITLNNQPAIISVGNVLRYSQSLIYQTSTNSSTIQNTGYQYPSVFSGVLLDVTPSIKGDEIILKVNPSITATKDSFIENQSSALASPPNLSTNQLSSIVRLKDKQKVILGGLISENESTTKNKIPILGSIPLVKTLFSYSRTIKQKREMIIVITPTIIDDRVMDDMNNAANKNIGS